MSFTHIADRYGRLARSSSISELFFAANFVRSRHSSAIARKTTCVVRSIRDGDSLTVRYRQGGVIDEDEKTVKDRYKAAVKLIAGQSSSTADMARIELVGSSASTSNPAKAVEDLSKFGKANEKQLYKLLRTLLDSQTDIKTHIKSKVRRHSVCEAYN